MDEILLIHNDNTPHLDKFDNSIKFNPSTEELNNSDIDSYISNQIIPILINKNFKIIYIKDTLSENYIDFYGLILAHHIRLSSNVLKEKSFLPIVILSDINELMINKLSYLGRILFTKNVFLCKNQIDILRHIRMLNFQPFGVEEFEHNFLDLIMVNPPEDSDSHSIANEWAIYKWAEFLKVESDAILSNKVKIEHMLYFKYLLAKYPLPKETGFKFTSKSPNSEGKILYVDDEWNRGWHDIFARYFFKSEKIVFQTVKENYKDKSYEQIESFIVSYIKAQEPDVIILDMRLIRQDHEEKIDEKDLSGIKLLSNIKEKINPGIQVVMLTASGKSSILDEANKYNILGYIKKEHPQDINIKTKESFDKLTSLINAGLDRKYLKKIWTIENDILTVLESNPFARHVKVDEYDDALKLMKITVKSIYILLDREIPNYLQYAMLAIFKCLEIFKDIFIKEQNNVLTLIGSNMPIKQYSADSQGIYIPRSQDGSRYYSSTENRLHALLFEKLNIKDKKTHADISSIVEKRNKFIHPDRSGKVNEPYNYEIIEWFRTLENIISKL